MKIYVQAKSIYFVGNFKEILVKINELAKKHHKLEDAINSYLN